MPRRLRLPQSEVGPLDLYLIHQYGEAWEETWRPMQGVLDLPSISKADMDHALHGWTRPLVDQLGPPPRGKLLQLPLAARACASKTTCVTYSAATCDLLNKRMPWCFQPATLEPLDLTSEVIRLWREGVYVLVVRQ